MHAYEDYYYYNIPVWNEFWDEKEAFNLKVKGKRLEGHHVRAT